METKETTFLNGAAVHLQEKEINVSYSEYGNEIEEIISKKLPFVVRWGTLVFFFFLLLIITACWFIKYPDKITARGVLNSLDAPKEVQAKMGGKLVKLLVTEAQEVRSGDIIGYIESTADHQQVIELSKILDSIGLKLSKNNTNAITQYFNFKFDQLGELQPGYQNFTNAFSVFTNYLEKGFYLKKKQMLLTDMAFLKKLHYELANQKELLKQDVTIADSTFEVYQKLKNEKVIATLDYRGEKSKLLSKQMAIPQLNTSIITNESQQHDKQKEIAELENQIEQQKNIFVQALNTFHSQADDWEKKYLLIAPIGGRVSFAGFIQEKQELKPNQSVCFINPGNTDYYAETLIPQYNFGKVKTGQQVLVKFQAYPYQEFGFIKGEIDFVNSIPTDSGYLAKVSLPEKLITNYNKRIQYKIGLLIQADIIIQQTNILQRLFYGMRKLVN